MLHLIWLGPHPWGTIPWRNGRTRGYVHSILKGKMRQNGCSRSCPMLKNVWSRPGALHGSPKVAWPWPLCSSCLSFARLRWSWGPSGRWCRPPTHSLNCYQGYIRFLWFPRLIICWKYQWGVRFVPRRRIASALECMGNFAAFWAFNAFIFGGAFWHIQALICRGCINDNSKGTWSCSTDRQTNLW